MQFDAHARQTRFQLTTLTPLDGDTIKGVIELDFLVTPNGNDRISNSYTPRIRHAFVSYKNWMVGQYWSTFLDTSALPETLDFIGSTDGTIFARQMLVKYTSGNWEFALENPETTLTPFGGGGRIVADDNAVPDLIARYTHKADWGHVKVAGLVRQLSYNDSVAVDDSVSSVGITVTGKVKVGDNDDIRFSFYTGSGLGRYAALNAQNGGVITADGQLETIDSTGFAIAYRHVWDSKWRSNFTYSAYNGDADTALTGLGVIKSTSSMRANLLYQVNSKIMVGGEFAIADRELESGADGDMNRLQFSMKYAF